METLELQVRDVLDAMASEGAKDTGSRSQATKDPFSNFVSVLPGCFFNMYFNFILLILTWQLKGKFGNHIVFAIFCFIRKSTPGPFSFASYPSPDHTG